LVFISGGVLIVSQPAEDPDRKVSSIACCAEGIILAMDDTWRQMKDEGKITQV
jgi:hypothetical protein